MYKFLFVAVITGFLFISCSGNPDSKKSTLSEGEYNLQNVVSNAVFSDPEGNPIKLEDYRGKVILLDFWESWCGPCLQVFPAMEKLKNEYPDDFVMLAVNVGFSDTMDDLQKFIDKNPYTFNYAYDSNFVNEDLGIDSIPFKVFIDPEGNLISAELGSYGTDGDYNKAKKIILEHKL